MFPSRSNKKPFLRKIRTVRTITTRRAKPNIGTYDSNETSLYLKHGSARQSYYLAGDGINEASHNRDAGNKTDNMGYGFLPV
mgnify:CR=1 FL=1